MAGVAGDRATGFDPFSNGTDVFESGIVEQSEPFGGVAALAVRHLCVDGVVAGVGTAGADSSPLGAPVPVVPRARYERHGGCAGVATFGPAGIDGIVVVMAVYARASAAVIRAGGIVTVGSGIVGLEVRCLAGSVSVEDAVGRARGVALLAARGKAGGVESSSASTGWRTLPRSSARCGRQDRLLCPYRTLGVGAGEVGRFLECSY